MKNSYEVEQKNDEAQLLTRSLLWFALLLAIMIIAPALMSAEFPVYPLMKYGDAFDLLTPLVMMPTYGWLLKMTNPRPLKQREIVFFIIFSVLWVEGHGIHLAANSLGHLLSNSSTPELAQLTRFYDEVLSHYIWHLGMLGCSALLIYRQWNYSFTNPSYQSRLIIIGGVIYGLTYFIDVIESATAAIGIPNTLIMSFLIFVKARTRLRYQPLLLFFLIAYGLANLLFLMWSLYWSGLPEFSQLGII